METIIEEDIKELLAVDEEPCVSIYMSTMAAAGSEVQEMSIRFKNHLNTVKKKMKNYNELDSRDIEKFLKQAAKLIDDRRFWQYQSEGLAVFIAPEQFRYYRLPLDFKDTVSVSKYFDIKQLMPELFEDRTFYVLALDRKKNEVYQCTRGSIVKQDIEDIPENIDETLKYDDPEENIQVHSHTASGSEAIYHGQGVTDEDNKEDLLRYLRDINQVINNFLKKKQVPLVVMCVADLFPLYRKANTYSQMMDEFIKGSPKGISKDEIHEKAREIVEPYFKNYKKEAVDRYQELQNTDKVDTEIEKIVPASYFSKIKSLLLQADREQWGKFDPEENELILNDEEKGTYELYNFAAINTINNGGDVYVFQEEEMPDDIDAAAIYRF